MVRLIPNIITKWYYTAARGWLKKEAFISKRCSKGEKTVNHT